MPALISFGMARSGYPQVVMHRVIWRVLAGLAVLPLFIFAPQLGHGIANGGTGPVIGVLVVAVVLLVAVMVMIHRWERHPPS